MQVGELVHVIADAHIYDRHIPIIKELIGREQDPAPKFTLNPEIKDFYQFTTKDITIEDYVTESQIKKYSDRSISLTGIFYERIKDRIK